MNRYFQYKLLQRQAGFSLAETLVAITIGAMILVAVLAIYSQAEKSAAAVTQKLDSTQLASEVLQRISEDLDQIVATGADTKVTILPGKSDNGYPTARLEILRTIYDKDDKKQTFEEIIWQASTDYESDANGLVLYRSHSGMVWEDKLLDELRKDWESNYTFVPVCTGVTFFKIETAKGQDANQQDANQVEKTDTARDSNALPPGNAVTISFAQPYKTESGEITVPDEQKITRTIAIDRTRKLRFDMPQTDANQVGAEDANQEQTPDVNKPAEPNNTIMDANNASKPKRR
jgi:prepilin-type N-terminal cleavage/methylation domain-containing protein